jgi:FkbM family methyltransferase
MSSSSLTYIDKALFYSKTELPFYPPIDGTGVSHSLEKYSLGYSKETKILVKTITVNEIINKFKLKKVDFIMLKLDIEGSEYQLLMDIDQWEVKPKQILVEFDFLRLSIIKSRLMLLKLDNNLRKTGYICVNRANGFDFLYVNIE